MAARLTLLLIISFLTFSAQAQYWFGPRVGYNQNRFVYQSPTYAEDSFTVEPSYNWEFGALAVYQATERFAAVSEIFYERTERILESRPEYQNTVSSKVKHHFLSVPVMLRVSFGKEPVHYYVNGGTKIRTWLTSNGQIDLSEFEEFGDPPAKYDRIVFNEDKSDTENGVYAVPDGNQVQFALMAGGGVYLDLMTGGRLMIDFRYTFGHSNMGFNNNNDFTRFNTYQENFRYRSNVLTLSLSYLFEYDVKEQSKGMSTVKDSNKRKKKK